MLAPPVTFAGRLRHLGPAFIITATIVGSGELIVTPKLGATVGFSLLWFAGLLSFAGDWVLRIALPIQVRAHGLDARDGRLTVQGLGYVVAGLLAGVLLRRSAEVMVASERRAGAIP